MSPRGGGGGDRTPEERERARRERERRRYERAGEPVPDHLLEPHERADAAPFEPEPPAPEPAHEPAPPEPEPVSFFDEPAPEPPAREPEPPAPGPAPTPQFREPEPPAAPPEPSPLQETQQWDVTEAWEDDHAARRAPDPDATQAHETIPSFPSEAVAPTPPPVAPLDPPAGEHADEREAPLGTRRVSRAHLPHIHRPGRGDGKKRRNAGDLPKGRGVRVKRPGEVTGAGGRRRRSAGPRIVAGVVVLVVLALLWFVNGIFQPIGGGGDGSGRVVVRIPAGSSAGDVAKLLEERRRLVELLLQPARLCRRQALGPALGHVHAQTGHEQWRRAGRAHRRARPGESAAGRDRVDTGRAQPPRDESDRRESGAERRLPDRLAQLESARPDEIRRAERRDAGGLPLPGDLRGAEGRRRSSGSSTTS